MGGSIRSVTNGEELLHFTNLPDVYKIISEKWSLFRNLFSCRRREFNSLMAPILKGRTDTAHNRPHHLRPPFEDERTKIACHDLLEKIKL